MRIRKIATSVGVAGKVLNEKSDSTLDTYSANYLDKIETNKKITVIDGYFGEEDINEVRRWGNFVHVTYRAKCLKTCSNSNTTLLTLPYTCPNMTIPNARKGERYDFSTQVNFAWANDNGQIRLGPITAGEYIHLDFCYLSL